MDKSIIFLKEWSINFIKNKDLIFKKIVELQEKEGEASFFVKFKDKEQKFIIIDRLDNSTFEKIDFEIFTGFFTYHSQENFNYLLKNWNVICQNKKLTIYFINPFISIENKWIIHPHTHSRIADQSSFLKGMNSMFESVLPVIDKDLKSIHNL